MKHISPLLGSVYENEHFSKMLKSRHALNSFSEPYALGFITQCLQAMALAFNSTRLLGGEKSTRDAVIKTYLSGVGHFRPSTIAEATAFILLGKSSHTDRPPNYVEFHKQCIQFIPLEDTRSDHVNYIAPPRPITKEPVLQITEDPIRLEKGKDQIKDIKKLLAQLALKAPA